MGIPKFIIENWGKREELSEEEKKLEELTERYVAKHGWDYSTEPYDYTDKQWIKLLERCLRWGVSMEFFLGETEGEDY